MSKPEQPSLDDDPPSEPGFERRVQSDVEFGAGLPPAVTTRPPGGESKSWLLRLAERQAPMGPMKTSAPSGIVLERGEGPNVWDVDRNRYVDLAAGFGALLLGHGHPAVLRAIEHQAPRLLQALGDVYPSSAKIGLLERLARIYPARSNANVSDDAHSQSRAYNAGSAGARSNANVSDDAQVILGQSGADAVTAALKTAVLYTKKTGLVAFGSAYHGLSYGALALTDLRAGYRAPFEEHLPKDVTWLPYPKQASELDACLGALEAKLREGNVALVSVEPVLGRGGVVIPPAGFLEGVVRLSREHGALSLFDEIWTGLGRTGAWLAAARLGGDVRAGSDALGRAIPDLICLGKGLGGGLPISACLGRREVMAAWSQEAEVVHTSTFAGAPLACVAALATLDVLGRGGAIERALSLGDSWLARLQTRFTGHPAVAEVRGLGMMVGLELTGGRGGALQRALLERGYVTSTGGGARDVLVLTPPLTIGEERLVEFEDALEDALDALEMPD